MIKIPFHIVIFGAQGSGKGTQADFLAKKYILPHLSAGVLIRKKAEEQSKEGRMVKKIIEKGDLIPFDLTKKLFVDALKNITQNQAVIFDGYPRAKRQYDDLLKIIKGRLPKVKRALVLNISDETSYKRLSLRRTCSKCERIYQPPSSLSLKECLCGGKLIKRSDDTRESIERRLKIYHKETDKVISFFKKNNELIEVDGEPPIKEVSKEVDKKIQQELKKF